MVDGDLVLAAGDDEESMAVDPEATGSVAGEPAEDESDSDADLDTPLNRLAKLVEKSGGRVVS